MNACRAAWAAQNKSKKGPKKTSVAVPSSSRTTNAWVSTSAVRPRSAPTKTSGAAKKTSRKGGGGGVFAAMMMDSDSD